MMVALGDIEIAQSCIYIETPGPVASIIVGQDILPVYKLCYYRCLLLPYLNIRDCLSNNLTCSHSN